MTDVVIVGAGGHGRIVADCLVSQGRKVRGFIDPQFSVDTNVGGHTLLGDDSWLAEHPDSTVCIGVGATRDVTVRERVYGSLVSHRRVGCIHSSVVAGTAAQIHSTAQVLANCVINHSARVGENVVVYTGCVVEHDCVIGEHSYLSPRVTLCGGVKIGSRVFIGAGAVVLPNVEIGDGATIAAGAVVVDNVGALCTVMGVPAKVVDSPR